MSLDFPSSPAGGDTFIGSDGAVYSWDGVKWKGAAAVNAYLPLTGGTVAGNVAVNGTFACGTSIATSGTCTANGWLYGGSISATGGVLALPGIPTANPGSNQVWSNGGALTIGAASSGGGGIAEAPTDGQLYSRKGSTATWVVSPGSSGGIADAPNDATAYARKSLGWAHLAHGDITDWATSISQPAIVAPLMNGTAAVGTSLLYARQDHVHDTDTSRYAASNPSGYQTAAQVTAALPVVSTTLPIVDGTAAIGASGKWADGAHVHPTDASRAPLASPTFTGVVTIPSGASISGYATSASLNNYLPISGGVVTGPVDLKAQAITATATTAINRTNGENVTLTLGVSITTLTISNWPASGTTGKVRLVIVSSGAFTVAWPAGTKWAGGVAPTLTSSGTDIVLLMTDNAGTTIYGSVVGQGYA